jgi:hypothetical protein
MVLNTLSDASQYAALEKWVGMGREVKPQFAEKATVESDDANFLLSPTICSYECGGLFIRPHSCSCSIAYRHTGIQTP